MFDYRTLSNMSSFIHLAAQSWYSQRQGVLSPDALAAHAAETKMDAIGVADADGLAGAVRMAKACQQQGIAYIPGVDLALTSHGLSEWTPALAHVGRGSAGVGQPYLTNGAPRITFLATDNTGLAGLCRATSAAYGFRDGLPITEELDERYLGTHFQPALSRRGVQAHLAGRSGVYVLFGPHSPCMRLLRAGNPEQARVEARRWMHWMGPDRVLMGLSHYGRREDDQFVRAACRLADELGLAVVMNQVPRFINPEDGDTADVLDAIRQQVRVGSAFPRRAPLEGWWGNTDTISHTFAERPDALVRTLTIAEETEVTWGLGSSRVPHFGHWDTQPSGAAALELRALSNAGLIERLGIDPTYHPNDPVVERLNEELALIVERGLAPYFLTVGAIIRRIRDKGILVACRGSAAGSLVAYALRISDVNPVEYGLIMERFLHRYRTDLPDIDIDVESHRREEIQRDLISTWGADRVTGLAMVATFRSRGAIRETGKAMGLPEHEINLAAKALPRTRAARITQLASTLPEAQGLGLEAAHIQKLFRSAEQLDGVPRHLALHPCGLILADHSLGDIAPLIPSGPREEGEAIAMIPYDKDDIEDLGLVKLDVLGVRMLSAMAHTRDLAATTRGLVIDFDAVDATPDPATFAMIKRADTIGMFQIESPGQRELIGRLTPKDTHDLVIDISLFRPGPVKGDMIEPFLRRRKGLETVDLPPILHPILAESHGVIVYHEQVIRCISAITGCDLGQADLARRNLGNAYALPELERWIRTWCTRRGINQATTNWLWKSLVQFASFGFCKAHAAAFSVPTYRSAWLKTNVMAEFFAGVLTHDPGMYPARLICAEARRHGILPLGVSINRSTAVYTVEPVIDPYPVGEFFIDGDYGQAPPDVDGQRRRWGIRTALSAIRGIDRNQINSICTGQPFVSISDIRDRANLSAPVAMDLAQIGAFDEVAPGLSRGDIRLEVEERWSSRTSPWVYMKPADDEPIQLPLFNQAGPPVGLPDISPAHQIRAEIDITGLDLSAHIISFYTPHIDGYTRAVDLATTPEGQTVRVLGAKVATQTPPVKSGNRIIFLTLDDGTGLADITFFHRSHAACARTVFTNWLLIVEGRVNRRGSVPTIIGQRAWPLTTQATTSQLWHASGGSTG